MSMDFSGQDSNDKNAKDKLDFVSNCFGFKVIDDVLVAERKENMTLKHMHESGYKLVLMYIDCPSPYHRTTKYVISKYDESVMIADIPALLIELGRLELHRLEWFINKDKWPNKNWNGNTTIGFSASYLDEDEGSYLSPNQVVQVILNDYKTNINKEN